MRIGGVRSERDLLEAILFPSASFVQNYEPVMVLTSDGMIHNGLLKEETEQQLVLQIDAQRAVVLDVAEVEERRAGSVSIMPAGLDQQLTLQELADLVAFLKSAD